MFMIALSAAIIAFPGLKVCAGNMKLNRGFCPTYFLVASSKLSSTLRGAKVFAFSSSEQYKWTPMWRDDDIVFKVSKLILRQVRWQWWSIYHKILTSIFFTRKRDIRLENLHVGSQLLFLSLFQDFQTRIQRQWVEQTRIKLRHWMSGCAVATRV